MEDHTTTTAAAMKKLFLIINCFILGVGTCAGPLIMRLYFLKGGKRIWFSSWLLTGGWPITLLPLLVDYTRRRRASGGGGAPLVLMNHRVLCGAATVGLLTGVDDYLYAYGMAKLPVSTSSLIIATQLAFTAGFAFLLVKQKFTAYSVNAVVLLTVGAVVLGLHTDGDRPAGESDKEYWLGFILTVVAAMLYGLILPGIELIYKKAKQEITYTLIMEIQLVMCFSATVFCTVGMVVNNDFQAISREAKAFELGETKYYVVAVFSALVWQCFFLGAIGVIYYSSSLLSAVLITLLLPATEILAVFFYHEKFQAEKGISLFLSLWGFISYYLGEVRQNKKNKNSSPNGEHSSEVQLPHQMADP